MKKIGLSIIFVTISILAIYSSHKNVLNEKSGDILSMKIDFLPAFDDICTLIIDTQKSKANFSIKGENGCIFMETISFDSLYNSCGFKSLFTESKLRIYQCNPGILEHEDGLTIRIEYRTKTKSSFIDAGNNYEKKLANIFLCLLNKIKNGTEDTTVVNYINKLNGYF